MPLPALPTGSTSWDGTRLALQNADAHRACADQLARAGFFGFAVSHLVLATEEAVKSFAFMLAAIGLPLPEADARKLLKDHKARHILAFLSRVVADFTQSVDVKSMFGDEMPEPGTALDKFSEALAGWNTYLAGPHQPDLTIDLEWWGQANSLKQAGMYVDYSADNTCWSDPSDITEIEYLRSAESVQRFFETVDKMIRPFLQTDEETQQLLTTFLAPLVRQLNNGRAEELSSVFFGSTGES